MALCPNKRMTSTSQVIVNECIYTMDGIRILESVILVNMRGMYKRNEKGKNNGSQHTDPRPDLL